MILSVRSDEENRRRIRTKFERTTKTAMFLSRKIKMRKLTNAKKEEDRIQFMERSTKEAEDHMKKMKTPCWIETHRRLKWRMAMRIASLPKERWTSKIIDWNPGLDIKIRANRSVGKPKKRWEDDINEFLRAEETEEAKGNDLKKQLHYTWKTHAKKHKEWKAKEDKFAKSTVAILEGR